MNEIDNALPDIFKFMVDKSNYFKIALSNFENYSEHEELKNIRIWLKENKIKNRDNFIAGVNCFLIALNFEILDKINNNQKELRKFEGVLWNHRFPLGKAIFESKKKKTLLEKESILKIEFLHFVELRLLNNYLGKLPSEIKFKKEVLVWIKDKINLLKQDIQISTKKINRKIDAPVIGLFCRLINESKLLPQDNVTNGIYCKKICEKYKLNYTDKVRQSFGGKSTTKHMKKLMDLIFPIIDIQTCNTINKYLTSKNPDKNKLYD